MRRFAALTAWLSLAAVISGCAWRSPNYDILRRAERGAAKITDYGIADAPAPDDVLVGTDVSDISMAPSGSTKKYRLRDLPISDPVAAGLAGKAATIADPNDFRLRAWDDTDGAEVYIVIGDNLSYDHATHTLSATGGSGATLSDLDDLPGDSIDNNLIDDILIAPTLARDSEVSAAISNHAGLADPHPDYLLKTAFEPYSVPYSDTDNTPAMLSVPANRLVGRGSTGGIAAINFGAGFSWAGGTINFDLPMTYPPGNGIPRVVSGSSYGTTYGVATSVANPGTDSNIPTEKAVRDLYTSAVDTNGWDYTVRTAAPTGADLIVGKFYRADNDTWDPITYAGTTDYYVMWNGTAFIGIVDLAGNLLIENIPAASVTNTPAGSVAATTVQGAINELDTEKSGTGHNHSGVYQPADGDLDGYAATTPATGILAWLATPSGANLATALTSALPASKGGTGLTALAANVVSLLGAADYASIKSLLTLNNVDNTSDATKNSATATLTNKSIVALEVDGHTAQTLTAAQVSNTIVYNTGQAAADVAETLPAAASGYSALFTVGTAQTNKWGVRAGASDKIYLLNSDGTISAGADNGYARMTNAQVGQSFACWTFKTDNYDWQCKAISVGTSAFAAN